MLSPRDAINRRHARDAAQRSIEGVYFVAGEKIADSYSGMERFRYADLAGIRQRLHA